jgi:hypothetical protein
MSIIKSKRVTTNTSTAWVEQWQDIGMSDSATEIPFSSHADRSVQVTGLFGSGGSVVIEGSNDGINWSTLTDFQGNQLSINTPKIVMVSEVTAYIRPRVISTDALTSITVSILVRS